MSLTSSIRDHHHGIPSFFSLLAVCCTRSAICRVAFSKLLPPALLPIGKRRIQPRVYFASILQASHMHCSSIDGKPLEVTASRPVLLLLRSRTFLSDRASTTSHFELEGSGKWANPFRTA